MSELPKQYESFLKKYPQIGKAYNELGQATHAAGPLDDKTRALVKLGIAIGARMEGGVHAHVRKALDLGITPDEIRHAVLLSATTIGFPNMMAAMTWVDDILSEL